MSTKHRVLLYLLVAPFIFSDRNLRLGGKFVLEDFGNCCNSQENCNKFDLSTAFGKKIWGQRGLRSLPSQNFIPDLQKLAERIALRSNESFFFFLMFYGTMNFIDGDMEEWHPKHRVPNIRLAGQSRHIKGFKLSHLMNFESKKTVKHFMSMMFLQMSFH